MLLRAENVKKQFGKEEILKGISLEVREKTFTVILGPSGSGKSTFLNTLSGLMPPNEGKVCFPELYAVKQTYGTGKYRSRTLSGAGIIGFAGACADFGN